MAHESDTRTWRATSIPRRDFAKLRVVLLVFSDPVEARAVRRSFAEACPTAEVLEADSVAMAAELVATGPITVVVGALTLPDGRLTELTREHTDFPMVVVVAQGHEERGIEAVAAGALDWVARSDSLPGALPHIALGAAREWREFGLRRAAEEQLRHADRLTLVGRVAAGVVHEVGTPLNVVRMRAQLLQLDPTAVPEATRVIVEQCDRIAGLLQRTLLLSRRQHGQRLPTDLRELATKAVELLAPVLRRHHVQAELSGEPVVVDADPGELLQIALNLLTNAMDSMEGGGTIRLSTLADDGIARLAVADTGPGVAPEHLPHVFAPFFTTKEPGKGTGLGLAVSAEIAADHGGSITVLSTPGEGATFTLELPLVGAT